MPQRGYSGSGREERNLQLLGLTHGGLGPPTPTINEGNTPYHLPTGQSDEGIFSIQVPSSQMALASVSFAINQPAHRVRTERKCRSQKSEFRMQVIIIYVYKEGILKTCSLSNSTRGVYRGWVVTCSSQRYQLPKM